jgi:RNA polymerase sigma factor (sigma-70 family)
MTQMSRLETEQDLATTWQEAQRGNQTAWETLFKECYPKVRRVVRRKLNRSMRSLYDSTDFANEAMERLAAQPDLLQFSSLGCLIAFLAQVAEQKVIDEYRRQHTLKHDVDRERPLATYGTGAHQLPSDEPTASQWAQANEFQERLLDRRDATERVIIELKQKGYSTGAIAEHTGWNIRKVQRFLEKLHDSLTEPGD